MKLKDIKLIIWDLDETFWLGTISEGEVQLVSEHIQFLKDTTDIGIVNSICSKNDFGVVEEKIISEGLWDYFVFPSIDWNAKGQRVKNIIDTMKLRPNNVLFIDDNIQNLEEAKHFCPELMTAFPQDIKELIREAYSSEKKDIQHKRLNQYKQLEEKEEARTDFSTNEDFLMSCNIKVNIFYDCEKEFDRIHELIMRSNQLNYTKFRQEKEALLEMIKTPDINTGYVKVRDRFGDYGIVGFFAVKDGELIHYVFSCRTLGMKVEQYVYYLIGFPEINTVGDVAAKLNKTEKPEWINNNSNQNDEGVSENPNIHSKRILFKGPCDMSQMYAFLDLGEKAVTEFTYMNESGVSVEGHNHTSQIVTALYSDDKRKREILADAEFFDKKMLTTVLENEKFDFVVLSMLTDGNLGIYKRKETGEEVSLCEKKYSLTNYENREKYVKGEIFTSFIKFTDRTLDDFGSKYSYVNNADAEVTVSNLRKIREYIDKDTKLILLLGSEREFKKKCKESYRNRHTDHAIMNRKIREWAEEEENVILMPFDNYIKSDADFIDTINHFTKRVYYDLACELAKVFGDENCGVEVKGKLVLFKATIKQKLRAVKVQIKKFMR